MPGGLLAPPLRCRRRARSSSKLPAALSSASIPREPASLGGALLPTTPARRPPQRCTPWMRSFNRRRPTAAKCMRYSRACPGTC
eukprot:3308919-Lingulodinium_polyedra.AAC.1